jgi:hypothetical protein
MRTRTGWLALLLTTGLALAPTGARGQYSGDYSYADPPAPLPLSNRPDRGGFYAAAEFMFFRETNPLKHQELAVRGLLDFDGSITAALNGVQLNPTGTSPIIVPGTPKVGNFIGTASPALYADDAGGPGSYEPGFRFTAGWKFQDGLAVEFSWLGLNEAKYNAVASLVPPGLNAGPLLADSFLFSPVYNFPSQFAGEPQKLAVGNPNAAYGIWNASSVMSISFVQRYSEYDISARVPMMETDYCRCYGLIGPRYCSLWENFKWRTVSQSFDGQAGQDDVAIYSNVVSNQMYGVFAGVGSDWWVGHGFSFSVDLRAASLIDFAHLIAKYELGDFSIGNKRALRNYSFVPELDASINIWWRPLESVTIRGGYNFMGFFDTFASSNPVSFNYGGLDPTYNRVSRFFDGLNIGIGFLF